MECSSPLLCVASIILMSVAGTLGSFLDVIPDGPLTEGDKVEIRCSEIFAYGFNKDSSIRILQNSTNVQQRIDWNLQEDNLTYSKNWLLTRNVTTANKMDTIYAMKYTFFASVKHNKMTVKCQSSRVSAYLSPQKTFVVRTPPEIMSCITNPSKLVRGRKPVQVKCWLMLGMPRTKDITVTGKRVIVGKKTYLYTTNSRFSYHIVRIRWIVNFKRFNADTTLKVQAKNSIGSSEYSLNLKPTGNSKKQKVVQEPNAKLTLEPDESVNLHIGDKIRCRVTNSTRQWSVKLYFKATGSTNTTLLATANTNEVDHPIPSTLIRTYAAFQCKASRSGSLQLQSKKLTNWIFPANHRSFLTMKNLKTTLKERQTAEATCLFLPQPSGRRLMNISLNLNGVVKFASSFDGEKLLVTKTVYGRRVERPTCFVSSNLFSCTIRLTKLQADDTNTILRCMTVTDRRVDALEKKIQIEMPPEVKLIAPDRIESSTNQTISVACLVRLGNPAAKEKKLAFENDGASREDDGAMKDPSGFEWQVLRISKQLEKRDHLTKLRCSAKNSIGQSFRSAVIAIKQPINNMTITPPPNVTLDRGQKFVCKAYGYPPPDLTLTTVSRGLRSRYRSSPDIDFSTVRADLRYYYPDQEVTVTCVGSNTVDGKKQTLTKEVKYVPQKWQPQRK